MSCVSSSFIKFTLLFLMGTPSHHPFQWGFSNELKHPASLGTPWKSQIKEATQKKPPRLNDHVDRQVRLASENPVAWQIMAGSPCQNMWASQ
jgi:hypothetical protein